MCEKCAKKIMALPFDFISKKSYRQKRLLSFEKRDHIFFPAKIAVTLLWISLGG
jgi:hypothetical protein